MGNRLEYNQTVKPIHPRPERRSIHPQGGFALVVTLSLMVLLSILALGMLSLATVELRSLSRSDSRAVARANALMALQIAIGNLQASAGADQRITAPGGVLGTAAQQQMITGVWKSRKLGPTSSASDFSKATKSQEFVRWLVSGPDTTALENEAFVNAQPGSGAGVIDLVSAKNLEPSAPVVRAAKVPVKNGTKPGDPAMGSYAYAVLDEGTKARVNAGVTSPRMNLPSRSVALGGGQRPGISRITGVGELPESKVDLNEPEGRSLVGKMVSVPSAELAYGSGGGVLARKIHDLTASSVGVLSDVANGGLKQDLNLLAEAKTKGSLPPEFQNTGIYKREFKTDIISDPLWSRALGWAGVFNSGSISRQTVGGISVPTIRASSPPGWVAGTGRLSGPSMKNPATARLSMVEPPDPVLLPSVAKIQMSFALAAWDIYRYPNDGLPIPKAADGSNPEMHHPWGSVFQEDVKDQNKRFDSPYDYLMRMIYSPVITLHNPYNVPITFADLRVEFVDVPFALQVFKNGKAQTVAPVQFSHMFAQFSKNDRGRSKRFGLTLTDTMLPGEVKVYSPYINPGRSWRQEVDGGSGNAQFWDWGNSSGEDGQTGGTRTDTSRGVGVPGWNGANVGYLQEDLCPAWARASTEQNEPVGSRAIWRRFGVPLKKDD